MNDLELKNPLTGGKVIAVNADIQSYLESGRGERGKADFVMSSHQIPLFDSCPSRWLRNYDPKPENTDALKWGSLIDCMLTQPLSFPDRYVFRPETYPAKDGEKPWHNGATYCKEWNAKHEGQTILSRDEHAEAEQAVARLSKDPHVSEILLNSDRQVWITAEYQDEETGVTVPVKGLIDLVPFPDKPFYGKCLVDLKTATSAAPRKWQRTVFERNYHIQAALYLDAYRAATDSDRTDFIHIVQENIAPYEPGRRLLSAEFIQLGRDQYVSGLRRYAKCLKTGIWPGYDEGERTIQGWTLTEPESWMVSAL